MTNQPTEPNVSAIGDAARPPVADRAAFQTELDQLRVREKAHTREGDAIAAARRRLPMVEVDPQTPLIGADGSVPLIDVFDGRSQLIAYFHMWHPGRPAAEQCEGCTFNTSHINELNYLHSRDASYAVLSEGSYEESSRYRDFMGYTAPWYSVPPDSVDRLIADRYFGILACYLRRRRPGLRDLLDLRPRRRGDGTVVRTAGSDCLRPAGVLGGLAGGLAAALGFPRWPVPGGRRPSDGPAVADPGRPRRRPRPHAGRMDHVYLRTALLTTGTHTGIPDRSRAVEVGTLLS